MDGMRGVRDRLSAWDAVFLTLLVASVALVFWHQSTADAQLRRALEWVDLGLVGLFLGEWAWRLRHDPAPRRWAARHAWELLGMVPLVLPLPAFLRVLRLLRLARILRVVGRLGEALGTWERIARESHLGKIAAISGSMTLAGAGLVWLLERDANGGLRTLPEALWWAVVTVTTVGYGDITPVTTTGRFVAAVLMVTGIGTIGLLASSLASVLVTKRSGEGQAQPAAPAAAGAVAPLPARAGSLAAELRELARLREEGHLSDAEYEAAKRKALSLP